VETAIADRPAQIEAAAIGYGRHLLANTELDRGTPEWKDQKRISASLQPWIDARRRFHLSHEHVQMARELGMNPKRLGKLDNHHARLPCCTTLPRLSRRVSANSVISVRVLSSTCTRPKASCSRRSVGEVVDEIEWVLDLMHNAK
jgi:hypothetical protein